jgi:hypothetical protein
MSDHPPPPASTGPLPDPRADRQDALILFLRLGGAAVLALAVLALVLPSELSVLAADSMVVALIAIPVVRVAWLGVRWAGRRDWRYVGAAAGLLAVLAVGLLVR